MKFLKKYLWWIVVSVIALGAVVFVYNPNPKPTPAVFDFNNGTTQGWTLDGVFDDAGKKYNGATFPPNSLLNQGNQLVFFPSQLGLGLDKIGFPNTSKYWQFDLVSPTLGPAWKGLNGIKASVRTDMGAGDKLIEVRPFVRYAVSGATMEIPAQAAFAPSLPHNKVTTVQENMAIPPGATLLNIVLRIRGQWATQNMTGNLYEGQVYVDDVTKIL